MGALKIIIIIIIIIIIYKYNVNSWPHHHSRQGWPSMHLGLAGGSGFQLESAVLSSSNLQRWRHGDPWPAWRPHSSPVEFGKSAGRAAAAPWARQWWVTWTDGAETAVSGSGTFRRNWLAFSYMVTVLSMEQIKKRGRRKTNLTWKGETERNIFVFKHLGNLLYKSVQDKLQCNFNNPFQEISLWVADSTFCIQ